VEPTEFKGNSVTQALVFPVVAAYAFGTVPRVLNQSAAATALVALA
jgi:hypothetical protein